MSTHCPICKTEMKRKQVKSDPDKLVVVSKCLGCAYAHKSTIYKGQKRENEAIILGRLQ